MRLRVLGAVKVNSFLCINSIVNVNVNVNANVNVTFHHMMQYRLGYQILSMSMSTLIPRYNNQLNKMEFLKLAAVAEWIK